MLKNHRTGILGSAVKKNRNVLFESLEDNQFLTKFEDQPLKPKSTKQKQKQKQKEQEFFIPRQTENLRNKNIIDEILNLKVIRKDYPQKLLQEVPNTDIKQQKNIQKPKPATKPIPPISSNWKKFIKEHPKQNNAIKKSIQTEYVALDCQYVQCQQQQQLARISIVNENDQSLFQSYVRPTNKIIDYRTHISGITYGHIKNAPKWEQIKPEVQKILYNKKIVGHTIHKDLQVMKMTGWFGFKGIIDISQYKLYQQNGKVQALKKLSLVFLQRQIQNGVHSSLQDAKATMDLFKLKKQKILQQFQRQKNPRKKKRSNSSKSVDNKKQQQQK